MTRKEKLLQNTKALRESIRLDLVEYESRSWTADDRREILGYLALCTLELNELVKRLSSAN